MMSIRSIVRLRTFAALVLTVILLPVTARSQSLPILFDDEFKDNHNEWPVVSDDSRYVAFEDDGYHVDYKSEGRFWNTTQDVGMNTSFDFDIELTLTQIDGTDDDGCGIIYGRRDIDNFHAFLISPEGKARVFYQLRGNESNILPWTSESAIKSNGDQNVLRIERRGEQTSFYINGEKIYTTNEHRLDGKKVGVMVSDVRVVNFRRLQVRQVKQKINLATTVKSGFKKVNLGPNVNTDSSEVLPLISSDGKTLYYARKNDPNNMGGPSHDDIWVSHRNADGTWAPAENLGAPVNNNGHNNAVSISPDNNTMLVMNKYAADGTPDGAGFSITHRQPNGWELPQTVEIENYYNDDRYTEACLGSDGRTMLLTLDRKDSYGQRDVYVSFQRNDGSWSEPKNLGPVVNSYDDETSPFLAADGVSLYYSTEGFPGYGSQDIFVSRRLDDTWEHWSAPQNLGPEINSDDWDAYYTIPASGEYAYVVSAQNSIGATDIFEIKLAETAKPKPVVLVKGKVFNSKTKQPLESQISYSDLSTNKEAGVARSDAKDGSYQIVLPLEKIYSFVGAKSGFYPISDTVNVKDVKSYQEITRDLYLSPIEVKQAIRLNNIFFDFDKTELLSESSAELDRLVALLKQQPSMRIELRGHTDNKGSDAYNQKLSDGRATAVLEYLASKGIDRNRMAAKGYGKTVPIASNDTEAGRAQNRRVEFMILEL